MFKTFKITYEIKPLSAVQNCRVEITQKRRRLITAFELDTSGKLNILENIERIKKLWNELCIVR